MSEYEEELEFGREESFDDCPKCTAGLDVLFSGSGGVGDVNFSSIDFEPKGVR